jgi:hypothetical protein
MNPRLIPILERIIARETILSSFHADRLPQSALAYVRQHYLNDNFLWLTPEEQDLLESLPPFADNLSESIRPGGGIGNPDSSVYHLFDDGSLWLKTNAYSSVWTDATDFAVEILLPRMTLSRMDAQLLRAIEMEDAVDGVRQDFFTAFAGVLHRSCHIAHCDARGHWDAFTRQLDDGQREIIEFGGTETGESEGQSFAETFKRETTNA